MFEAFATLLKEKLYFFLEDIQKLKYFFFKRLILVTPTQIFGKPNGEIMLFLDTDPITQQVSQFSSTNSKAMFWKLFVQIMEDVLY